MQGHMYIKSAIIHCKSVCVQTCVRVCARLLPCPWQQQQWLEVTELFQCRTPDEWCALVVYQLTLTPHSHQARTSGPAHNCLTSSYYLLCPFSFDPSACTTYSYSIKVSSDTIPLLSPLFWVSYLSQSLSSLNSHAWYLKWALASFIVKKGGVPFDIKSSTALLQAGHKSQAGPEGQVIWMPAHISWCSSNTFQQIELANFILVMSFFVLQAALQFPSASASSFTLVCCGWCLLCSIFWSHCGCPRLWL